MNVRSLTKYLPALTVILLSACIHTTPEIIKIGVVAPFEGRYREIGVDVIPAARLAVSEWSAIYKSSGIAFEIAAYDDGGDAEHAIQAARRLTVDPDIAIVIGHWGNDTTLAALPIYENADLPLVTVAAGEVKGHSLIYNLSPSTEQLYQTVTQWQSMQPFPVQVSIEQSNILVAADEVKNSGAIYYVGGALWGMNQFYALASPLADNTYFLSSNSLPQDSLALIDLDQFVAEYKERSLGEPPGIFAVSAYQATWIAIQVLAESRGIAVSPPVHLPELESTGQSLNPPLYLYKWQDGERVLVQIFNDNR